MADDHDMPGAGRPKRQPPTLELAATNVSERPVAHEAAEGKPAPDPEPPQPGAEADTSPSDMPPFEPAEPATEPPATPRDRPALLLPVAAGAVAGAVVAGIAWFALGALAPAPDKSENDALAARIAQLEARPLPKPDSSLAPRIDALDKTVAALKAQTDRIGAELTRLAATPQSPATVNLAPVTARLNAIERATAELKSSTEQQNARPVDDSALRRVIAAALLDTSVRQHEPYAAALAAMQPLAGNDAALQPLAPFAASGLPGDAALSRDLLALLPNLSPAPGEAPASAGFLDRLQAGAAKLVRVERLDAPGSAARDAAGRAAAAARSNDVATAQRELLTLAPDQRAAVQPWLDRVAARDAALSASRQFAADAMAALSKPAP